MDWQKILFHSGDLFLPTNIRNFLEQYWIGDDKSLFYISWWTFIHFISGNIVGYILLHYYKSQNYYLIGFIIHSLWELWQIIGKNTKYWTLRGQIDVLVDTIAFMIGLWFYKKINFLTFV